MAQGRAASSTLWTLSPLLLRSGCLFPSGEDIGGWVFPASQGPWACGCACTQLEEGPLSGTPTLLGSPALSTAGPSTVRSTGVQASQKEGWWGCLPQPCSAQPPQDWPGIGDARPHRAGWVEGSCCCLSCVVGDPVLSMSTAGVEGLGCRQSGHCSLSNVGPASLKPFPPIPTPTHGPLRWPWPGLQGGSTDWPRCLKVGGTGWPLQLELGLLCWRAGIWPPSTSGPWCPV